jgi:hypothetical protein
MLESFTNTCRSVSSTFTNRGLDNNTPTIANDMVVDQKATANNNITPPPPPVGSLDRNSVQPLTTDGLTVTKVPAAKVAALTGSLDVKLVDSKAIPSKDDNSKSHAENSKTTLNTPSIANAAAPHEGVAR